jgi:hypothetical protein
MLNENITNEIKRLKSQYKMLSWALIGFFLLGAACTGLLVLHLHHDYKEFGKMNETVQRIEKQITSYHAEQKP